MKMMKKAIIGSIAIFAFLFLTDLGQAATFKEIKGSLVTAREKLLAMIDAKDKGTQEKLREEVNKASQEVDSALSAKINDKATPDAAKAKLSEFKETWEAFKTTRDTELIPAILAGNTEKAKALATGVQAERYKKMTAILDEWIKGEGQ